MWGMLGGLSAGRLSLTLDSECTIQCYLLNSHIIWSIILLYCLVWELFWVIHIIIIRLLAVLSTILLQSWPDPPYLHYTLSKLSHGFAPPWMLTILRLLLRVKPRFWWWWLQMMIKMHRPWPPGVSAVTEWGVCQDLHPHTNFLPDGNEISFFCL